MPHAPPSPARAVETHPLDGALRKARANFVFAGVLSVLVNLLMLTGPVYMLLIYDKVLASGSQPTLVVLTGLVVVLYAFLGAAEYLRGRIFARVGATIQSVLDRDVFALTLQRSPGKGADTALNDLETVQKFFSSPVAFSIFDIIWTPIFVGMIYIFHPVLGYFSVVVGIVLIAVALLNRRLTRNALREAAAKSRQSNQIAEELARNKETLVAMGMGPAALDRWERHRFASLAHHVTSSDAAGVFTSLSKTIRLFAQSFVLALGAWYVLQQELAPGMMIAASILMGRALAPIEQTIGQWPLAAQTRAAWRNLREVLADFHDAPAVTPLPRPEGGLAVDNISVTPPGAQAPTVKMLSFEVKPGEALAVIGPSGSGKSTLARALCGIWPVSAGEIRLGRAGVEQYDPAAYGSFVGYLPQDVRLFFGTVAENIARLDGAAENTPKIIAAAKRAGAHEMIFNLPKGYDTDIREALSGGQKQRVALARALYGDPHLLVLDEPNSNLDSGGAQALNAAIREVKKAGGCVVVVAHRPSAISECENILVLENGVKRSYGPTQEIMRAQLRQYNQGQGAAAQGQGAAPPGRGVRKVVR